MVETFRGITAGNYLFFRREYMVEDKDEFILYNRQENCRTIESRTRELECLQQLYEREKTVLVPIFDAALISDHDRIFNLESQRQFYGSKMKILPNAKHHDFFRFFSLAEILNY